MAFFNLAIICVTLPIKIVYWTFSLGFKIANLALYFVSYAADYAAKIITAPICWLIDKVTSMLGIYPDENLVSKRLETYKKLNNLLPSGLSMFIVGIPVPLSFLLKGDK